MLAKKMKKNDIKRDPFIHLTRLPDPKARHYWFSKLISVVIALLICALITNAMAPGSFGDFFKFLGLGTFSSSLQTLRVFQDTAILLLIALALTPAFKMKFWNIGAEGQVLIGALGATIAMKFLAGTMPNALLIFVCLALSILFSIIWAVIPAIFKAFFNTNATLFTLMMNYLASGLVAYFVFVWVPNGSAVLGVINPNTHDGWLPKLFGQDYLINIITVVIITVLIFVYLKYSKHGYELTVVGESQNTARYVGINVKKTIIRTLILSGAVCGLVGFLLVNGTSHTLNADLVSGRGFTGILVAWLGHFNPFEMIFTAFLVAFITLGGSYAGDIFRFGTAYSKVLIGIFFFVFIASEFFLRYKMNFSAEVQAFFKKISDFFAKIFGPIGRFFKKIFTPVGRFFKKIFAPVGRFFKKLFKKKDSPKEEPVSKEE